MAGRTFTASPLPCLLGSIAERGRLQSYTSMHNVTALKSAAQVSKLHEKRITCLVKHAYAKVVSPHSRVKYYDTKE